MSRRNITFFNFSSKFLLKTIPKNINKRENKVKTKIIKNRKVFLAPNFINYSNYVLKRGFSKKGKDNAFNRHYYEAEVEKLINEQINLEFIAAYAYFGIAMYYGRSDVALPGLYGFFMKMYFEELSHGLLFAKYQNLRGGKVKMADIPIPNETEYADIGEAFTIALELEKTVKEKMQQIFNTAGHFGDTNVQDMLDPLIADQEKSIFDLSRLYTRVSNLSHDYIGKYLFDRELHETHVQKDPGKCVQDIGPKLYA